MDLGVQDAVSSHQLLESQPQMPSVVVVGDRESRHFCFSALGMVKRSS